MRRRNAPHIALLLILASALSVAVGAQGDGAAELERLLEQARQSGAPAAHGLSLDPGQLEALTGQAAALQRCLAEIDPAELETLRRDGERLGSEIRALCDAGARVDAQRQAMEYARAVSASPVVQRLRGCGTQLSAMLNSAMAALDAGSGPDTHVCNALPAP